MNSLSARQKQIIDFVNSSEYKKLNAYYSQSSIFSALGVSRHENTHSNFLAWLLSPAPQKNNHGLGDLALRKFFETLTRACMLPHSQNKLPQKFTNAVTVGAYALSNIGVEREKAVLDGRIDIYITGNVVFDDTEHSFTIIIENKVKSDEHNSQTERYLNAIRSSMSRPDILLGVFLTPLPNREYERLAEPECDSKEFIQLNYQYLADNVITPCLSSAQNDKIKNYLNEYLLALSLPETRQDKGDIIMAISSEEKELLTNFWNTHKDLLTVTLLTLGDYVELEESEEKAIQNASKVLQNIARHTRYSWEAQGIKQSNLPQSRMVLEIIKHYAENNGPFTLAALQQVFPKGLVTSFETVEDINKADASNFKGHKRYYTDNPIALADGLCAVCTQWKNDNIGNFIACAEKLGYKINSTC